MRTALAIVSALLVLAACGDKNNDKNSATNNTNANNGVDMGGTNNVNNVNNVNNTTPNNVNNTTPNNVNNTTPNNVNNTTPNSSNNNSMDMGQADTGTDMGGGHLAVHGCTFETATDLTGMAAVSITDVDAWELGHGACIIVTTGTVVSWTGNFTQHPLDGGTSPTDDPANPIEVAGDGVNGNATIDVTFDTAGDYPYFCGIHTTAMRGVVYVID